MSNNLPNLYMPYEILGDNRLTLRQIRVLMAIFSWRKSNTNIARISREMISERTGYPLTRVSNITTQLEKLGWIEKKGNGGKSKWCQYKVKELRDYKSKNSNGEHNGNHDQNSNDTVTDSVSQTMTDSDTGIDTVNTGKEQYKKIYKKENLIDFFDDEKKSLVQLLIDHRKENTRTELKTVRQVKGLIKELGHYAVCWKITFNEALDFWLTKTWVSIDIKYDYPFRPMNDSELQAKKGTVHGLSDMAKKTIQHQLNQQKGVYLESN